MALPPQFSHQLTLKCLLSPLLLLNFALYAVVLGISGWAYNEASGGDLIQYTLLAGVVGMSSVLAGLYYVQKWTPESKASAIATSIVALPLQLLALGIASKHIEVGLGNTNHKVLQSFAIIVAATQLLYTLLIHGFLGEDKIYGYTAPAPAAPADPAAAEATAAETTEKEAAAPEEVTKPTGEDAV